jgi:hypothetical protein
VGKDERSGNQRLPATLHEVRDGPKSTITNESSVNLFPVYKLY